jgi:hypothetical protein
MDWGPLASHVTITSHIKPVRTRPRTLVPADRSDDRLPTLGSLLFDRQRPPRLCSGPSAPSSGPRWLRFSPLHRSKHCEDLLRRGVDVGCHKLLRPDDASRSFPYRLLPCHGPDRQPGLEPREYLHGVMCAVVRNLGIVSFCWAYSVGYAVSAENFETESKQSWRCLVPCRCA